MLLVHGMQCNHTHMLPQFEHFSRTHRLIAVDMRGHGQSDKPHSAYSNREFNDDLVFLCAELGLGRPVAMGHSFGGSNLLNLTEERPDFLSGLVIFDSGIRTLTGKVGELKVVGDLTQEQRRKFFGERLFGRDDPAELKESILDGMLSVPDHAASAMRETVLRFDGGAAAVKCRIPALFLLADKPFTGPETLATLGDNWRVGQVVGAGHFIQLIAPAQVNAMIDRFLEVAGL
ncbi:MAG: alpha/beta hydrolase fold protein [Rhodospirillales bacterium]|nr:alpha/beta hydrolase fold protein [Rhodospirillales bacterium]